MPRNRDARAVRVSVVVDMAGSRLQNRTSGDKKWLVPAAISWNATLPGGILELGLHF